MWSHPPKSLSLNPGEVHVWRAELQPPLDVQRAFLRTLDGDERERANRFHFEKHRRRFIVARGFLRSLLGEYLDTKPEDVRFRYGPYGKPSLAGEHAASPLRFNMSHSHEMALFAFVNDQEIGIDVEHLNREFEGEEIARRFFTPNEVRGILSAPPPERATAFFRCWTRKEAYIKALGSGLSQPLDQFDVNCVPDWSLIDIEVGDDYAAAVALEGEGHRLHRWYR